MNKDFIGINHGKNQIDLSKFKKIISMLPIEIHLKEDGSVDNEPSFAIVMTSNVFGIEAYGEISLEMFNKGLNDIGYEIIKKQ